MTDLAYEPHWLRPSAVHSALSSGLRLHRSVASGPRRLQPPHSALDRSVASGTRRLQPPHSALGCSETLLGLSLRKVLIVLKGDLSPLHRPSLLSLESS